MNIEKLRVQDFKRFTDLEIDLSSCQAPPKLVLLIGANGSGKSSVFDAFEYISAPHKQGIRDHYVDYFEKGSGTETSVSITLGGGVALTRSKGKHNRHDSSELEQQISVLRQKLVPNRPRAAPARRRSCRCGF